jgi:lysophospholipase L1-like esterase
MIGCMVLSLAATARDVAAADGQSDEPVKVACVGDSITAGSGIKNRDNYYPAVLQNMLGQGHEVRNFGVSGATLLEKGNKPYIKQRAYRQALKWRPDVVVIMLGTNDTKKRNWEKHHQHYVADYRALISSFQGANPQAEIHVVLPVPAFPTGFGIRNNVIREEVLPRARQAAELERANLINLYEPFKDKADLFPDRVHPNAEGAKLMAKHIYNAISN